MTYSTELIVLNHTKFGENSVVLHTLSRAYGRRSFLVRTGSKAGMALFLPLNLLEAVISENPRATLWNARSLTVRHPLAGIRGNLFKNTITLFMSEVLYRTVRDGADPDGLFDWCERSILTLDALESDFSNYPIRFLLELAVTLGFQPTAEDMAPYAEHHLQELRTFLQAPFGESMLLPLSGSARNEIAQSILRYLEHHTESAIQIRSLAVLRELFSETGKP